MCLGIPGRVVALADGYAGQVAVVDVEGAERKVNVGMLEEPPAPGDWVLIHMGFAVEAIDEAAARTALGGLQLMGSGRAARVRRRYDVFGLVQGVGFRPFVYVTASELGLAGSVSQHAVGGGRRGRGRPRRRRRVRPAAGRRRRRRWPRSRAVARDRAAGCAAAPGSPSRTRGTGAGRTLASPDIAVCDDCLRRARRPGRPALPAPVHLLHELRPPLHDHHRAALRPGRHHDGRLPDVRRLPRGVRRPRRPALPRAAGRLPRLRADARLVVAAGTARPAAATPRTTGRGSCSPRARSSRSRGSAATTWRATPRDEDAVAELRRRKQRGDKPFAVMARDLDVAGAWSTVERRGAAAHRLRKPVVLLPRAELSAASLRRTGDNSVARGGGAGQPRPRGDAAVHPAARAAARPRRRRGPDVLVMTSGNLSGEPIVTDDEEACERLARPGRRVAAATTGRSGCRATTRSPAWSPASSCRCGARAATRRCRWRCPFEVDPVLATGADLKNTCAVRPDATRGSASTSGTSTTWPRRRRSAGERHLEELTGVRPAAAGRRRAPGLPLRGLGPRARRRARGAHRAAPPRARRRGDGRARPRPRRPGDRGRLRRHRLRHRRRDLGRRGAGRRLQGVPPGGALGYVPLAGGDASVRRPYRMALSHLRAAGVDWADDLPAVAACPARSGRARPPARHRPRLRADLQHGPALRRGVLAGRGPARRDYEAEAAIELESLARTYAGPVAPYAFGIVEARTARVVADPGPVVRAVVRRRTTRAGPARVAARFHAGVAALVVELAGRARDATGLGRGGARRRRVRQRAAARHERAAAGGARVHRAASPAAAAQRRRDRARTDPRSAPSAERGEDRRRATCVWQYPGGWCRCTSRTARHGGGRLRRVRKEVCLAYIPDVQVGEYVIVHVGFAIQRLDERSAQETLANFERLGILEEEFGDGFARAAATEAGVTAMKYLDEFSDPDLARRLLDQIHAVDHPALGDDGGLRGPDALDHPARHRPAAARRRGDDPRPGLPGLRDPAGDHRQGTRHRRAARA